MSQQERSSESSRRLLDAAIELIAEKGFERTTAIEIGVRAGYSRAMVRARYGTKEALLETLLRSEYEPMFLAAPTDSATGLQTLLDQLDHLASQGKEKPELLRAFFIICFETVGPIEHLNPWLRGWLDTYRDVAAASLRRGQSDGSVRADLDADTEAGRIVTYGLGLGFRWTLDPERVDFADELRDWADHLRVWCASGG